MSTIAEDRKAAGEWDDYLRGLFRADVIDLNETPEERLKRIADLEKPGNEEKWFKHYFPNYYSSEAAPFHIKSTRLLFANLEYYLTRAWSREMAKDARTMMELIRAAVTKIKRSVLLISSSQDKAVKLLRPYKICFESNQRLINDYGEQMTYGEWTDSAFKIKAGCSFVAIGVGQTPRGLRNEEVRPDVLLMTDLDTDEDCRNPEMVDKNWAWFEKAAYPTRSVNKPTWVIWLGNIIAEYCCIKKAIEISDRVEIVNIEDKDGNSNWPQKNSLENIQRIKSKISYAAFQGEYMNNPVTNGKVFKEVYYGKMRPLKDYQFLVSYCDPSYKKKGDYKAVVLIGKCRDEYHVIRTYCNQTTTGDMLDWHYEIAKLVNGVVPVYYYVEWPWIDDPLKIEIEASNIKYGFKLPLRPDDRDKPDKYHRIESSLEPLNRNGKLIFNEQQKGDAHMTNMEAQFLALSPTSRAHDDGPDAVEGGVFVINSKTVNDTSKVVVNKFKVRNTKRN